jgi:uncharacterized membrane protein YagU involved in acid resistance
LGKVFLSAFLAALAAGIPDIYVAAVLSRSTPAKVLQGIASGVLGAESYGASNSASLGLGLQIAMSFLIALIYNVIIYTVAVGQIQGIRHKALVFGAVYGFVIFFVMNFVVVPLSRAEPKFHWDLKAFIAMLVVMVLFGEVISLIGAAVANRI